MTHGVNGVAVVLNSRPALEHAASTQGNLMSLTVTAMDPAERSVRLRVSIHQYYQLPPLGDICFHLSQLQ